jgi:K+-sensing histidine kinase KdpD
MIIRGSDRKERMVGQILDTAVARTKTGFRLNKVVSDLNGLARQAVEEASAVYAHSAIHLHEVDDGLAPVDRDRILQVFSNLIGNAVHCGSPDSPIDWCWADAEKNWPRYRDCGDYMEGDEPFGVCRGCMSDEDREELDR